MSNRSPTDPSPTDRPLRGRWAEVEDLFGRAVEMLEGAREDFLAQECVGRPELRREVQSLLDADRGVHMEADRFLEPTETHGAPGTSERTSDRASEDLGSLRGQALGAYRILDRLGRGGMATVYIAARERDFDKKVAIKIFDHDRQRDDLVRRFEHERQILAALEHPYIARLLDGGSTDEGLPYLVLELIDGEPIDVFCDRHRLSVDQRINLFCQLCDAVSYAHRRLLVHRDLKPQNVLVTADSTPKLLDFGIAKLLEDDRFETQAGHRLMITPVRSRCSARRSPPAVMSTASASYSGRQAARSALR